METAINTMRMGALIIFQNHQISTVCYEYGQKRIGQKRNLFREQNFKEKSQKLWDDESEAINHIKVMIDKVAQTEARVLITGPNGTEKN
jgi:DNA-binding NtrC family response regulator